MPVSRTPLETKVRIINEIIGLRSRDLSAAISAEPKRMGGITESSSLVPIGYVEFSKERLNVESSWTDFQDWGLGICGHVTDSR